MHLLFKTILLVPIPPLIVYIFFNRQIVAGMTSGGIKG
jgi:raffinose/stachyose/melibiose transport system permease protein